MTPTLEQIARAIEQADNQFVPEGFYRGKDPMVSDWGAYLATAVLSLLEAVSKGDYV